MSSEQSLRAGGLDLRVVPTAGGLRLAGDGELESLAVVVNGALDHGSDALRHAVEEGEEYVSHAELAGPPSETFDLESARERWRARTGSELGDDVVVVGTTFTNSFALPRAALLEILDRLSGRQPALPDSEWERLERRAAELDRDALGGETPETGARRRVVLIELDVAGVLSDDDDGTLSRRLEAVGCPTLLGYRAAALALRGYLGPGRPLVGAPVSLDWYRLAAERPSDAFTAACEAALDAGQGGSGEVEAELADGTPVRLAWRRDDGVTPALLRARKVGS